MGGDTMRGQSLDPLGVHMGSMRIPVGASSPDVLLPAHLRQDNYNEVRLGEQRILKENLHACCVESYIDVTVADNGMLKFQDACPNTGEYDVKSPPTYQPTERFSESESFTGSCVENWKFLVEDTRSDDQGIIERVVVKQEFRPSIPTSTKETTTTTESTTVNPMSTTTPESTPSTPTTETTSEPGPIVRCDWSGDLSIPDNSPGTPVVVSLTCDCQAAAEWGNITKVSVMTDISHELASDLRISIQADGSSRIIKDIRQTCMVQNYVDIVVEDSGTELLQDACPNLNTYDVTSPPAYKPLEPFFQSEAFIGECVERWEFLVADHFPQYLGRPNSVEDLVDADSVKDLADVDSVEDLADADLVLVEDLVVEDLEDLVHSSVR
ncbi:unnamed protein product [Cyprideis torosa]|uniref:Uncharacterized protein n=1 Tax=Cyprideis torosa TaxID=163714 RepID=A0A7R8ZT71_9CRUS|nr:unnamed protein product [Cyprideis torosa]CAG0897534.1 unnamed protein product [Cyprideis torosa]